MSSRRKRGSATWRIAIATSRRAAFDESSVLLASCEQRRFRLIDVLGPRAAGHGDRRRRADPRIGIGEERARERRRIFLADRRERADRGGADAGIAVAEHAADLRDPLLGDVAAHGAERGQRAPPDHGRLVIEEQRRHEVPLVDRLEHVNGVDHALRIRVRELLHQRFDRRQVGDVQPQLARGDVARDEALAERAQVLPARAERHEDPQQPAR